MDRLPKGCCVLAIPYKTFKQRVRLIKGYERLYKIEILERNDKEGVLYMEKRGAD